MPAPILHIGATVLCTHAGPATPATPFPRVTVSGQPIVTLSSPWLVTGCALSGSGTPPCVSGQFMVGAARVTAGGVPVVTMVGTATCMPTGTPLMPLVAQPRVMAT